MNTVLTVPGRFVPNFRVGLVGEWGFVSEDAARMAHKFEEESERAYTEARDVFNAVSDLLDAVGWHHINSQTDVEIDLGLHPLYPILVLKALQGAHGILIDQLQESGTEHYGVASAHAEALGDFVKAVSALASSLRGSR